MRTDQDEQTGASEGPEDEQIELAESPLQANEALTGASLPELDASLDASAGAPEPYEAGPGEQIDTSGEQIDAFEEQTGAPGEQTGAPLARVERADLAPLDPQLAREAARRAVKPLADATRKAYARYWNEWTLWCTRFGKEPFPAREEDLAVYLLFLSKEGLAPSSIEQVYIAIRSAHRRLKEPLPTLEGVNSLIASLRREQAAQGIAAEVRKDPLLREDLRAMLAKIPKGPAGVRDKAILLLGFGAALRRSELAALDVGDVSVAPDWVLRVRIGKSKTDQEGRGVSLAILPADNPAECAGRAVAAWLKGAGLTEGPLFRPLYRVPATKQVLVKPSRMSPGRIAKIVKAYAKAAGLDESRLSGHSLRAGFATQASNDGLPLHRIMEVTRHESERVARGYIRNADPAKRAVKLF